MELASNFLIVKRIVKTFIEQRIKEKVKDAQAQPIAAMATMDSFDSLSLIPIINDLQLAFKNVGFKLQQVLELPQIVVVGIQSCGKSSVLESLVHRSFLPRGTGIVTRTPIILQLIHIDGDGEEYAELIADDPNEPPTKFTDFSLLEKAIETKTIKIAGANKGISAIQIGVRVYSPNVVDLTVVDLPGIVKVPTGDQPQDIEKQVTDMINHYIKNRNSIILAVCPANVDLTAAESLKMAKEVDPNGERTLVVLTKLDLLDKGVTALKELRGEVVPNKLGVVGLINRSQQDILENKSVDEVMKEKKEKLEKDYPSLVGQIGSLYLAQRMKELLLDHIKKSIPDLKLRVSQLAEEETCRLVSLGQKLPTELSEKIRVMTDVIQQFENDYRIFVEEKNKTGFGKQSNPTVGSKINKERLDYCTKMNAIDPFQDLNDDQIMQMLNYNTNWEGFTSTEDIFKQLVKKQIRLLEKACVDHAEEIHKILHGALQPCLLDRRLAKLNMEILAVMRGLLDESLVQMKSRIKTMFEIHSIIVFTTDDTFSRLVGESAAATGNHSGTATVDGRSYAEAAATSGGTGTRGPDISAEHKAALKRIKLLIGTYFGSVRQTIMNVYPKEVLYYMYHETLKAFHSSVGRRTYPIADEIMVEPLQIADSRRRGEEFLEACKKGSEILNRIQDTRIMD